MKSTSLPVSNMTSLQEQLSILSNLLLQLITNSTLTTRLTFKDIFDVEMFLNNWTLKLKLDLLAR